MPEMGRLLLHHDACIESLTHEAASVGKFAPVEVPGIVRLADSSCFSHNLISLSVHVRGVLKSK